MATFYLVGTDGKFHGELDNVATVEEARSKALTIEAVAKPQSKTYHRLLDNTELAQVVAGGPDKRQALCSALGAPVYV